MGPSPESRTDPGQGREDGTDQGPGPEDETGPETGSDPGPEDAGPEKETGITTTEDIIFGKTASAIYCGDRKFGHLR